MKPQRAESSTCDLFPEMVDIGTAPLAHEKDIRAAVAEARRVAGLLSDQVRDGHTRAEEPAFPVEPGSLAEAIYWYRRLALPQEPVPPIGVATGLCNLAYALRDQKRWGEAEAAFFESLPLFRQYGYRSEEGHTFLNLGDLYKLQERWKDAEAGYTQGLAIVREFGDHYSEAMTLGKLSDMYLARGQPEKASTYREQAIAAARAINNPVFAQRMLERLNRSSKPGNSTGA